MKIPSRSGSGTIAYGPPAFVVSAGFLSIGASMFLVVLANIKVRYGPDFALLKKITNILAILGILLWILGEIYYIGVSLYG